MRKKENNNQDKKENEKQVPQLAQSEEEIKLIEAPKKIPIFTHTSVILIVSILIMGILDIWCYADLLLDNKTFVYLFSFATALVVGLSIVFLFTKKVGWLKTNFVIMALAFVFTWGYYLFVALDLLKYMTDAEALQEALSGIGWWKYLVFFLIQFLQVTFIPIPAMVTTIAGSVLFGPGIATLLSIAGILTGSIVAFIIGDKCGEKVVAWIVGEKQMKKYSSLLFDKGKYIFFLMMLFPLFPDDVLCLVAGMTTMSYKFFIITILLTRPIGIFMTCYLSVSIPYHGWGLVVWAILIVLIILMFWISYKYKDKIEEIITKFSDKITRRFSKNKAKQILIDNAPKILLLPEKTLTNPSQDKVDEIKKNKNKTKKRK